MRGRQPSRVGEKFLAAVTKPLRLRSSFSSTRFSEDPRPWARSKPKTNTYADDLSQLMEQLNLRNAIRVGHSASRPTATRLRVLEHVETQAVATLHVVRAVTLLASAKHHALATHLRLLTLGYRGSATARRWTI